MANGTREPNDTSFPAETFAKLTPGPFLQAHLKQNDPIRPNGRRPNEFRAPVINTGSLTHSNGSAVVRLGDTAIVCGVRAEILLASDIPHPPSEDVDERDLVEDLGLLVPNVELSTGCSPSHLPGNPPGAQAQSLSYRISSLLYDAQLFSPKHLAIRYVEPPTVETPLDEQPEAVVKAYWVLYVDILCISLDGNAFDAAWAAIMAAFQDTVLPNAWWDPDQESVVCSPRLAEASRLKLSSLPVASSFALFSTASPVKNRAEAESSVLADPDEFEESVCEESLTIVVSSVTDGELVLLNVEKTGGPTISNQTVRACVDLAKTRWTEWNGVLKQR